MRPTPFALLTLAIFAISSFCQAANFVVVTSESARDQPLVDYLQNYLGHSVTVGAYAELDVTQSDVDALNAADMVIITRNTNSGNYATNATEVAAWDSLTVPVLLGNSYISRTSRWMWVDTDAIQVDYNGDISDPIGTTETHPLFSNLDVDMGDLISSPPISGIAKYDWTSSADIPDGTTLLGSGEIIGVRNNPTTPNIIIASYEAGSVTGSGNTLGGNRYFYALPEDLVNFRNSGLPILNNILSQEFPVLNGDVNLDGQVTLDDFNLIRDNFGNAATMRSVGDLNADGTVNFADFNQWKNAAGPALAAQASWSAVPEPGAMSLFLLGMIGMVARRWGSVKHKG
ncbi:PEP-CTERM sorting domain-containing protein [Aeoliella mucimassa]|uniref:PEP-CTERM protein-sorting domain-containing protein n=1 Tax=Aeoliella mucimassa TaxID=2527972 RepID=A0A518APJ3_9BACT|nr:PEP-CTERM sorting domain-containing protein [Aeoliella mucimassa]QDU56638.1 hypothetical protein Pan181_28480 [Aeoliella mucimassa]